MVRIASEVARYGSACAQKDKAFSLKAYYAHLNHITLKVILNLFSYQL